MNKNEMIRMKEALSGDEALMKKYEETVNRILSSGEAANDGEVIVKAAAELGFDISIEDLERAIAEQEQLSDNDLENIAGGGGLTDEYGHDDFCVTIWHCYVVTAHTETNTKITDSHKEACLVNFGCYGIFH